MNQNTKQHIRPWLALCMIGAVLAVFSGTAAAGITSNTVSGKETRNKGGDTQSTNTKLPVGPGPSGHGSSPINPKDFGFCGLLALSGNFDNHTIVEINVKDGYYNLNRTWLASIPDGPVVTWTCVPLTDFKGLPPNVNFRNSQSATVVQNTAGQKFDRIPGPNDACTWAGVAGGLSLMGKQGASQANALWDGPAALNVVLAQSNGVSSISTYTFCSWFTTPVTWQYANGQTGVYPGDMGPKMQNLNTPNPPLKPSQDWCYMDGIGTFGGNISAKISYDKAKLSDPYTEDVAKGTTFYWNCLPLSQ